ncbi:hypothetical protein EJ04DRAFT_566532 [Polyplosphaeria fusca]|uniref:Uncharacterized protein n=1 Tax=Polyplosphaeria fusca TaxID=682080 RepID=A0A9P4QVT4_9PLEO|nr:hypothetical protein EJ04DRAFT_566532 [Polyplosphaeria fusca]
MAPPRKALIAITSAHAPLYPEGKETGLFITEALHPFNVFKDAGFEVDLVSETGTYQADWLSETKDWLPEEDKKVWEDHSSEFRTVFAVDGLSVQRIPARIARAARIPAKIM